MADWYLETSDVWHLTHTLLAYDNPAGGGHSKNYISKSLYRYKSSFTDVRKRETKKKMVKYHFINNLIAFKRSTFVKSLF